MVTPHACCNKCCPEPSDITLNQTILDLGVDALIVQQHFVGAGVSQFAFTNDALSIFTPSVYINGILQPDTSYTLQDSDADTNYETILLDANLPLGANMTIIYARAV